MYLVSLIIPVYNAEKYLDNTLNSIINQTIGFNNIELILVDDASTDSSKKIIEKYAKKYENIFPYFSTKNHGNPGFGRNMGLKKSTADYIMFMDNDDEIDKNFCKKLYETMINENADIVCCNTRVVDSLNETLNNIPYHNGIEKENFIIIKNDDILLFKNNSIWNKIYKKSIIEKNNITFKEDTYADDLIFTSTYFLKSNKLIYLKNYFGYTWNIRSHSLSHSVKKEHIEGLIEAYTELSKIFKKENKEKFGNEILSGHTGFLLWQCTLLDEDKTETKKILKEVHDFEIENNIKRVNSWDMNILNYFILNEKYTLARILFKNMDRLRKSNTFKKIWRKIYSLIN